MFNNAPRYYSVLLIDPTTDGYLRRCAVVDDTFQSVETDQEKVRRYFAELGWELVSYHPVNGSHRTRPSAIHVTPRPYIVRIEE